MSGHFDFTLLTLFVSRNLVYCFFALSILFYLSTVECQWFPPPPPPPTNQHPPLGWSDLQYYRFAVDLVYSYESNSKKIGKFCRARAEHSHRSFNFHKITGP